MDSPQLKTRTTAQFYQGIVLVGLTVLRTAHSTGSALMHEHPFALLFILVFGVLLFPMAFTAVIGTVSIILLSIATILISVFVFSPILLVLTVFATFVWILAVAMLGSYRYFGVKKPKIDMQARNERWQLFKSLEAKDDLIPLELSEVNQDTYLEPSVKRSRPNSLAFLPVSPEDTRHGEAPLVVNSVRNSPSRSSALLASDSPVFTPSPVLREEIPLPSAPRVQ